MVIRDVTKDDEHWIQPLFDKNKSILGPFSTAWYRYWQNENPRERWIAIEQKAFAHYLIKKDGEVTLYEIAVGVKRQGLGKALLDYMGYPMTLKTDKDNLESNMFYKKCGFVCVGIKKSKNGNKVFNIYTRWS